ncbi:MAG: type II toxin-antitoxin system RelE/ParE family toxin [Myxococcales bacterium]|nr:type II toxin-antitoxin system RelE/ParE family toxin [Myxococcales bacterium]
MACKRTLKIVIEHFADKKTESVFHGETNKEARRIPKELWTVARRKLDMLHAAHAIEDLRIPPGNRLESLSGDLAGFWSIRINEKYRIVFKFDGGVARDVKITDYH